jgi:hypothetical protein
MLVAKGVDAVLLNNFMGSPESFAILESAGISIVIMQARSPRAGRTTCPRTTTVARGRRSSTFWNTDTGVSPASRVPPTPP